MFQTQSVVDKVQTMVDGGVKLTLVTQELSPHEMTELFALKGKLGWMLFKSAVIKETEVPEEPAQEFKTDKTPSQRLRAALYVYWDKSTNKSKPFDALYKEWMEKKISEIKEYLPE